MERTEQEEIDLLNTAVDKFAAAMKAKLTECAKQGKRGWDARNLQGHILAELLNDAYALYDEYPGSDLRAVDVANRAMMVWYVHQGMTMPREVDNG